MSPLINCAAVALELYLKSLCAVTIHTPVPDVPGLSIITAKAKASHGLIDLLESIPDDIRQSLQEAYAAAHHGSKLRDALQDYEGMFEASRYVFEKGKKIDTYSVAPLMDLCSFLRNFVTNMGPVNRIEW